MHRISNGRFARSTPESWPAPAGLLRDLLGQLGRNNQQGEFYLTDVVGLAADRGIDVIGHETDCSDNVSGVNDRAELARLERVYQRREAGALDGSRRDAAGSGAVRRAR